MEQVIARNCAMLMESKSQENIHRFTRGQKKEHVNQMREKQSRSLLPTLSESRRIGIKTENIDVLKVKVKDS